MKRLTVVFLFSLLYSCNQPKVDNSFTWECMNVRASAYNSLANQTSSNPFITAFGDSIKPGDNYIAVSRNLLRDPLKENTIVSIEGLDSLYIVKDKMNRRYWNTIDVYMGLDVKAARKWGRRNVTICYQVKAPKDSIANQP